MSVYEILDVPANATDEEIAKKYKRLAAMHHPDHGGDPSQMAVINEAYAKINTPEKRKAYDTANAFTTEFGVWKKTFGDSTVANAFGDTPSDAARAINGADVKVDVKIPMEYFVRGGKVPVKYRRVHTCQNCSGVGGTEFHACKACDGKGVVRRLVSDDGGLVKHWELFRCGSCDGSGRTITRKCDVCHGDGKFEIDSEVETYIDPMQETATLVGRGDEGRFGGENGKLVLRFRPKDDGMFSYEDGSICCHADFPFETMVSGGIEGIPFYGDFLMVDIPAHCKCGTVLTGKTRKGKVPVKVVAGVRT